MFKSIKLRFYHAMATMYLNKAAAYNKTAREYIKDSERCRNKSVRYINKVIAIMPVSKEEP